MSKIPPNIQSDMHSNASAKDAEEWEFISSEDLVTTLQELELKTDTKPDDVEIAPPTATLKHSSAGGVDGSIDYHTSDGIGMISGQDVKSVSSREIHGMDPEVLVPGSQVQSHAQQDAAIRHEIAQAPTPSSSGMSSSSSRTDSQKYRRATEEEALSFISKVQNECSDQPQIYNDFIDTMSKFGTQSIDTQEVITRVSHLFKGHPELIVGFNFFLPSEYKIEIQANEQGSEKTEHNMPSSGCILQ